MPRYVVLEHDFPELHWDFMLESGAVLHTWRLSRPPQILGITIGAVRLPDHRLEYLDYEGPIRGDRGMVRRWDWGVYEIMETGSDGRLRVRLLGEKVRGVGVWEPGEASWAFFE